MKYKNIVVANTKGGVGKSTIAFHILPYLLKDSAYKIVEIDNNNNTAKHLQNSNIKEKITSVNIQEGTIRLEELVISNIITNEVTIIDAGGGDDSRKIIKSFINHKLSNDTLFLIPYMADFTQVANLLFTRKLIEQYSYAVVANNIDLQDENDLMFVRGNEDFDIPNFSEMFEKFAVVEKTSLFSYSTSKQMLITDLAKPAFDYSQDQILNYARKKTNSNQREMLKIYRNWKISKLAKTYLQSQNIQNFKNLIFGDHNE
jgi:cellulose biosynthesis protein BcsQ